MTAPLLADPYQHPRPVGATPVNHPQSAKWRRLKGAWALLLLPLMVMAQPVPEGLAEAAQTQPARVCFFERAEFGGRSVCVGEGAGSLPSGWSNRAASVTVPAGWLLELTQSAKQGGRSISVTTPVASLADLGFVQPTASYRAVNVAAANAVPSPAARPVSALCNGTSGPAFETPLSSAGVERSVSLPTDRKRVVVKCVRDTKNPAGPRLNVLRSDQNSPLRGGTSWVWKADQTPGITSTPAFFVQMRKAGLNAVRVIAFDVWEAEAYGGAFLTNFDNPTFLLRLRALLETTVNLCSNHGMYCVINAHNKVGAVNLDVNRKFWAVMAPYFANRTHVIFEQANEPLQGSGVGANYAYSSLPILTALRNGFNEIRAAAPNTHIMVLSPTGVNGWGYVDAMTFATRLFASQPGPAIDWTNASVAYHLYANDAGFGSPNAENLRNLHASYAGWPSENNFPPGITNATLNITDDSRSQSYANETYVNQTSELLGLGWSLWNVESPSQFTRNFPLIVNDARSKAYLWRFDAKVAGELTP